MARNALDQLKTMCRYKGRRVFDQSIAQVVNRVEDRATDTRRRLGKVIDVWDRVVPEEVGGRTKITALRAGVLYVRVESSSMRFELDRLLRGGLEDELRRSFHGSLRRVKVTVGE